MNKTQTTQTRVLELINAALSLQQAREWEQSNTILRKVEAVNPEYAPAHLLLGINYQELGEIEAAERSLRRSLDLDPDYEEALQTLGLLLANQGRLEEAIPLLRNWWSQDQDNPQVLEALSSALLQVGETEDAVKILRKTWEQTQEEEPGVLYGRFLIQLERLDDAETVLREVQQRCPCPRTLTELALVLLLQDKNDEAADVLEHATELDPNFDRAWRGLAGCYDRLGKHQRALEVAKHALRLDAEHCRNWLVKAGALLSLQKYKDALQAARQGITFADSEDEETLPVLFQLYELEMIALLRLQHFDEALERLEENQTRFPTAKRFAEMRASLLFHSERYEQALEIIEAAQAHGIEMKPMKYRLLHALGHHDEAWACILPDLEDVAPESRTRRLEMLSDMALDAYIRSKFDIAYAILEQLHAFAPDTSRLLNNLGFLLTGKGNLDLAEQRLKQVAQQPDAKAWQAITSLNLAYLYLIQARYDEAVEALRSAQDGLEKEPDAGSVSRIAYWREGEILPEYTAYPLEFYPVQLSIWANEATFNLAQGDVAEAETLTHRIIEAAPEQSLGYRVLGWVLQARGQFKAARESWQHALEYAQHPDEQAALNAWLETLPDSA